MRFFHLVFAIHREALPEGNDLLGLRFSPHAHNPGITLSANSRTAQFTRLAKIDVEGRGRSVFVQLSLC